MRAGALSWRWLGRICYRDAVGEMESRRARILDGDDGAQAVLLCEHDPVITLGRAANQAHVLWPAAELAFRGVEVARSSRGGDVTYHGPGQLMVYPVVRLRRGVVAHLTAIASALAEVAAELGAPGARFERSPAGLWIERRKLAACGIHVRRGVAIHGFALDVATPSEAWRAIVPCGLHAAPVVSLTALAGGAPAVSRVAERAGPLLVRALIALSAGGGTMDPSIPPVKDPAVSSSSTTQTMTRS
jgi:lipoate-protein ligase B